MTVNVFSSTVLDYCALYLLHLKGTYYGKFTFTWCLNINVCWQCVSKTHPMIKIHPVFFLQSQ